LQDQIKIEPEFRTSYLAWKSDPTPQNADALLKDLYPVIKSSLLTYAPDLADSPSMVSKAKLLILDVLPKYNPKQGRLKPFLQFYLQRLRRYGGKERQVISIPERVVMLQNQLQQSRLELEQELGRPPSDAELADYTGISLKKIRYAARGGIPQSMENWEYNFLADSNLADIKALPGGRSSLEAAIDAIYLYLTPQQQYIVENYYGFGGRKPKTYSAIARELKVPVAKVKQELQQVLTKAQNYVRSGY